MTIADQARAAGTTPQRLYLARYRARKRAARPAPVLATDGEIDALETSRRTSRVAGRDLTRRGLSVAVGKPRHWWATVLRSRRLTAEDAAKVAEYLRSLIPGGDKSIAGSCAA